MLNYASNRCCTKFKNWLFLINQLGRALNEVISIWSQISLKIPSDKSVRLSALQWDESYLWVKRLSAINSEDKSEWKKPGVKGQKLESLKIIQPKPTIKHTVIPGFPHSAGQSAHDYNAFWLRVKPQAHTWAPEQEHRLQDQRTVLGIKITCRF